MTQIARTDGDVQAQGQDVRVMPVTPDQLIGYVNTVTSATKKGSYYNLPEEHIAALNDGIAMMADAFRPFPSLMMLSPSITDDARIASGIYLLSNEPKQGDIPAIRKWECAVIQQAIEQMPVTRVMDFFQYCIGWRRVKEGKTTSFKRIKPTVGGRYLRGIIKRWAKKHFDSLDYWSVKYTKDLRAIFRNIHMSSTEFPGVGWLFGGPPAGQMQLAVEKVRTVDRGAEPPAELWKLPYEVARGHALDKFGMTKEQFEERFSKKGQKTQKEKRLSAKRTAAAGGEVEYNPASEKDLFALYTYLGGQDQIPTMAPAWIGRLAKIQAERMQLALSDCAVILDTSPSMFGTMATKRHPLFRALAVARILEKSTDKFELFMTTDQQGTPVIPKLGGATSYAPSVLKALKAGFTNIFLLGDGYENAPEGMTHRVLYAFKKKLDPENKVSFIHLNPVAAAEDKGGVREVSPYAPSAGLTHVKALPSAVFLSLAKAYPVRAIEAYFKELVRLQAPQTTALMPPSYQRLLPGS